MSVEHTYGERVIDLGENQRLVVRSKGEEYHTWDEVTFESPEGNVRVGSYTTGPGGNRQWMDYNSNYVMLLSFDAVSLGLVVRTIFHIPSRQIISPSDPDEMLDLYNQEFRSDSEDLKR